MGPVGALCLLSWMSQTWALSALWVSIFATVTDFTIHVPAHLCDLPTFAVTYLEARSCWGTPHGVTPLSDALATYPYNGSTETYKCQVANTFMIPMGRTVAALDTIARTPDIDRFFLTGHQSNHSQHKPTART